MMEETKFKKLSQRHRCAMFLANSYFVVLRGGEAITDVCL